MPFPLDSPCDTHTRTYTWMNMFFRVCARALIHSHKHTQGIHFVTSCLLIVFFSGLQPQSSTQLAISWWLVIQWEEKGLRCICVCVMGWGEGPSQSVWRSDHILELYTYTHTHAHTHISTQTLVHTLYPPTHTPYTHSHTQGQLGGQFIWFRFNTFFWCLCSVYACIHICVYIYIFIYTRICIYTYFNICT